VQRLVPCHGRGDRAGLEHKPSSFQLGTFPIKPHFSSLRDSLEIWGEVRRHGLAPFLQPGDSALGP
jgi:hypothetical protein